MILFPKNEYNKIQTIKKLKNHKRKLTNILKKNLNKMSRKNKKHINHQNHLKN